MKETTQNNILLAEFLGWKRETVVRGRNGRTYDFLCPEYIEVIGESDSEFCSDCGRDTYRKDYLFGEDLLFDSDWNWLMPVVEKINIIEDYRYTMIIHSMDIEVFDSVTKENVVDMFSNHCADELIKSIYDACLMFIKYYNQRQTI